MATRKRRHRLENWEISLVKAMLARGNYNDQEILAYFTRPTRSINHRVIAEIINGSKHGALKASSHDELEEFLAARSEVDLLTGHNISDDELLIKAREAMIAAVHIFNSVGLNFKAELFIVTAIIAWTYLLHAFLRREGVDFRYYTTINENREVQKTSFGAEKYWDLSKCLKHNKCPLDNSVKQNLRFLLELRNEIEHRSTNRIDDAVSDKLQACCINFNDAIKKQFGMQYSLERRLSIALQFVTFDANQRELLKRARTLPKHIEIMIDNFHNNIPEEVSTDPRFTYRIAFVQKPANRTSSADQAIEFVRPDSNQEKEIHRILEKEVGKNKYRPSDIVRIMRNEGYDRYRISQDP